MAKQKEKKDKFEKFEADLSQQAQKLVPDSYESQGHTVRISGEVKKVAGQALAADMAWRERIDDESIYLNIERGVKGEKGLASTYRQWSKALGGPSYDSWTDDQVVSHLRRQLSMYRSEDLVDDFIHAGDASTLSDIRQIMVQDAKGKGQELAKKKIDKLRSNNGMIPPDKLIELKAAMASYQAMTTLNTTKPSPYSGDLLHPENDIGGMVNGLYSPTGGGPIHRARNLDKLVNQYAN
ncbi:hypothetical protein KY362_02800 [Candidatus Woesearchaeota archaeon]|nr:hypothetical protein [Candidatus Woesearchaeota archaeon]